MYTDIVQDAQSFDSDMRVYNAAITAIENIQELITVINRHGVEESIKDLFGQDLAQLSPAYAAGGDEAIVVAELNTACEGLGQKIVDTLKDLLRKLVEFVRRIWNAIFAKTNATEKKIEELDKTLTDIHEMMQESNDRLAAQLQHLKDSNTPAAKRRRRFEAHKQEYANVLKDMDSGEVDEEFVREHCKVLLPKDEFEKLIVITKDIESKIEGILRDVAKDPRDAFNKHKQLFDAIHMTYRASTYGEIHPQIDAPQREYRQFLAYGYPRKLRTIKTYLDTHKQWLSSHKNGNSMLSGIERIKFQLIRELEKEVTHSQNTTVTANASDDQSQAITIRIRNISRVCSMCMTYVQYCSDVFVNLTKALEHHIKPIPE